MDRRIFDTVFSNTLSEEHLKAFFEDYFKCKLKEDGKEDTVLVSVYFRLVRDPSDSSLCAIIKDGDGYSFVNSRLETLNGPFKQAVPLYVNSLKQLSHAAKNGKERDWIKQMRSVCDSARRMGSSDFGMASPKYFAEYGYADACLVTVNKMQGIVSLTGESIVPPDYARIRPMLFSASVTDTDFVQVREGNVSLYVCYTGEGMCSDVYDTHGNLIFKDADTFFAEKTCTEPESMNMGILAAKESVETVRLKSGGRVCSFSVKELCEAPPADSIVLHSVDPSYRQAKRYISMEMRSGSASDGTLEMMETLTRTVSSVKGLPFEKVAACIGEYGYFLKAQELEGMVTRETELKAMGFSEAVCGQLSDNGVDTAGKLAETEKLKLNRFIRSLHSTEDKRNVRETYAVLKILFS